MGVPFLFGSWLRSRKYSSVIRSRIESEVSSLALDLNSLIYLALQIVYANGDYKDNKRAKEVAALDPADVEATIPIVTMIIIKKIVEAFNPKDTLIVAVDGPPPMGKIQQQRSRRYESAVTRDVPEGQYYFDTSVITPGTSFMMMMDAYLEKELQLLSSDPDYSVKQIIYSSHLKEGEGEHKIMDYYREGRLVEGSGAHIIYGKDADLLVLSLLSPIKNIYWSVESVSIELEDDEGNFIKSRSRDPPSIVDIDELRTILKSEMSKESYLQDFALIVSMVGNDFIPHPPTLSKVEESIQMMLRIYTRLDIPLTTVDKDGRVTILWNNMYQLINLLSESEGTILNMAASEQYKYPSRVIEYARVEGGVDYNKYRNAWYTNALLLNDSDWAAVIGYNQLTTKQNISNMCYNFLKGINWTLQYYTSGQDSVTWKWYYPYHHAPLVYDLAKALYDIMTRKGIDFDRAFSVTPDSQEMRMGALHQLLSVIHPTARRAIPFFLGRLYMDDSPLSRIMPKTFPIEREATNLEWQTVKIIPFADADDVMQAYDDLSPSAHYTSKYRPKDDIIYDRLPSAEPARGDARAARGDGRPSGGRGRGGRGRSSNRGRS